MFLLAAPKYVSVYVVQSCTFCSNLKFYFGFIYSSQVHNIYILQKDFPGQWQKKEGED